MTRPVQNAWRLLAALFVFAAPAMAADAFGQEQKFHVSAGRFRRSFDCGPSVVSDSIERGTLLADVQRGPDRWLLLSYWEPSNPAHPNSFCGGGRETFLLWLHVRANTVLATQSELYASCRQGIEGGRPKWSGQHCSVAFRRTEEEPASEKRVDVRTTVLFDRQAPEKGLQVNRLPPAKPE